MRKTYAVRENGQLELWGGIECTIARVRDTFRDEVAETGHDLRPGDIDLIASLGIRTVRYPILWEKAAAGDDGKLDFGWTDERLAMLRERGINVIGGLVHHGSGPPGTDLLDPDFAAKLGDYAGRVAEHYPWIRDWTPVNEPLTTARFACLYGHWYPHRRDYRSFLRALVNQLQGSMLAMRAMRAINPAARFIQTEDLGKTFSTEPLRHQAEHENERRWLGFDLLCGRVGEDHPLHRFLIDAGISEAELELFASGEGRPDLLGINHYLTSERFLDHRLGHYPDREPGGNGRDTYVDAEAVRVGSLDADTGVGPRLREAWDRYRIPMAITEVHHGCTRDEQLRWFAEVWRTAGALRDEGVDLKAVTLWSIFGALDWRSLLTVRDGHYDVGAFDIRAPSPRPTAVAAAAKSYAGGEDYDHPVLDVPGWWRRPQRLYPWSGGCNSLGTDGRKLLITGATGTLGNAFARICEHRGLPLCVTARGELDLGDRDSIRAAITARSPWAVINTAGFVRVADAENEPEACMAANRDGAARLAEACAEAGIPLVTFSSDLVFDGSLGRAYLENDPVSPTCVYGRSKAEAERLVLGACERALIIRTSAFFGPWDRYNFAWYVLTALARGERVEAGGAIVSPTFVPDLCHAALDLLIDGETGIRHVANQGALSWHDFARRVAEGAGFDPDVIAAAEGPPANNALASGHGTMLRPLEPAIEAYLAEVGGALDAPFSIAAE